MKSKRAVIVVLNYMNYQDTKECVDSILKQDYDNYHVVIVDNDSKNESYSCLKKIYKKSLFVSIIKAGENYGFAKGNNIGIYYAKKNLKAEYIMLLNSDTILNDPLYLKKMIESDEDDVGVIGSTILQKDRKKVKKIYRYVTFPSTLICYLKFFCESKSFFEMARILEYILSECKGDYILQGCVLLLTPAYFRKYDNLDPRTFLYCEEELLFLRCKKAKLKEKIIEELSLFHKVSRSSEILYGNNTGIYNQYLLSSYKFVLLESVKNFLYELCMKYCCKKCT